MPILDISQEVTPAIAVFPGDTPFRSRAVLRMADGGSCDLASITTTVHAGSHADAPGHFLAGGASIGEVPLEPYLGPARVVVVTGLGPDRAIGPEHLAALPLGGCERLLLRTGTAPDPNRFNTDFAHLTVAAAERLAALAGLVLVGIDTPSMDRWDARTLSAHRALGAAGIALLENLVLGHVPPGDYELIALPLKLVGLDAAPVRAVLRR
jgi:arylformamidase